MDSFALKRGSPPARELSSGELSSEGAIQRGALDLTVELFESDGARHASAHGRFAYQPRVALRRVRDRGAVDEIAVGRAQASATSLRARPADQHASTRRPRSGRTFTIATSSRRARRKSHPSRISATAPRSGSFQGCVPGVTADRFAHRRDPRLLPVTASRSSRPGCPDRLRTGR